MSPSQMFTFPALVVLQREPVNANRSSWLVLSTGPYMTGGGSTKLVEESWGQFPQKINPPSSPLSSFESKA